MSFLNTRIDCRTELLKEKDDLEKRLRINAFCLKLIENQSTSNKSNVKLVQKKREHNEVIHSDLDSENDYDSSDNNDFNVNFISNESNSKRKRDETSEEDNSDEKINEWKKKLKLFNSEKEKVLNSSFLKGKTNCPCCNMDHATTKMKCTCGAYRKGRTKNFKWLKPK